MTEEQPVSDEQPVSEEQLDAQDRSTRRRIVLVGGVLPIAIALVATIAMFRWLPELPDPIAIHWTSNGPDGFGPALPLIFLPLGIVAVFSLFSVGSSLANAPGSGMTWTQKFLLSTSVWLSALLSVGIGGSVAIQRGLADAQDAPDVGGWLLAGAGVGLVLAAGSWFLLPKADTGLPVGFVPEPIDVRGSERVSWMRTARLGNAASVVIVLGFVAVLVVLVIAVVASQGAVWVPVTVLALLAALAATNTWWRVSADRRGFLVQGMLGWPRKLIPLDNIRSVQVIDVNPTRDFGGWGWRWGGNGRSGVILRAGEAIEVSRSTGKRFVVTVDDAGTGAGVLAALLALRAR